MKHNTYLYFKIRYTKIMNYFYIPWTTDNNLTKHILMSPYRCSSHAAGLEMRRQKDYVPGSP